MGLFDFIKQKAYPKKYVVLDIETTGLSRNNDRIIEIAANEYVNGTLSRQFHTYVNPGMHIPMAISHLNGIWDKDVEGAPSIIEVRDELKRFIGKSPIVGHNIARFDIPFLSIQMRTEFKNSQFDTLQMAKDVFPGLPCYKLSYLDKALHLGSLEHHRASNDIVVNNALFLACKEPHKYLHFLRDKEALAKIPIEQKRLGYHDFSIHSIVPSDPSAHPNTPLTGQNIVFSGYFHLPIQEMMQLAVDAGAVLKSSISKKVNYLVVGEQNECFQDENGMTSKQRTATKLIEQGQADIKIIDEEAFLTLIHTESVL